MFFPRRPRTYFQTNYSKVSLTNTSHLMIFPKGVVSPLTIFLKKQFAQELLSEDKAHIKPPFQNTKYEKANWKSGIQIKKPTAEDLSLKEFDDPEDPENFINYYELLGVDPSDVGAGAIRKAAYEKAVGSRSRREAS